MQTVKMTAGAIPILALLAFAPLASSGDYSFFVGYPDGYQSYEAYAVGKTSATTSVRATSAGTVEIATQSKQTAATDFEPRISTSLATQGISLWSKKFRGLLIIFR